MESLDYWRLCHEVSIMEAALLIVGEDPVDWIGRVESLDIKERPTGYDASKAAIISAIMDNALEARVTHTARTGKFGKQAEDEIMEFSQFDGLVFVKQFPDIELSKVKVASLRSWLTSKGVKTGFFFPNERTANPDYLSPSNPYYAPKLAAAVDAWVHVTSNPVLLKGKKPKQALEKWLREHAAKYGLTKEGGSPNEQGIEDAAKVANWNPKGGAASTPSADPATN